MPKYANENLIIETTNVLREDGIKVDEELVRDVIELGQAGIVERTIKSGGFESVTLPYLGKIKADHNLIRRMNTRLQQKKNNEK